jgi:lipoprotein-anchoring transpeptidase ErfK/SrfK
VDTLKTAVIVVLLLAVVYGAYVVLSKPDEPLPQEIAWHEQKISEQPLQIDMGTAVSNSPSDSKSSDTGKLGSMWSSDKKLEQPKFPMTGDSTPEKPTAGTPETATTAKIDKPSAAGFSTIPANPLLEPIPRDSKSPDSADLKPPAAPNLLGGSPTADAGKDGDSSSLKSGSSTGLPSLPELRTAPVDDNAALGSAESLSTPKAPDSMARLDPVKASDATSKDAKESKLPPGAPDPALGPLGENGSTAPQSVTTAAVYDAALREAQWQMDEGKWQAALSTLSKFIHSPDLTAEQNRQLYDLLDPLAAKVIYSPEHLVEAAYEVRRGDRLADIAQTYQVPWELLANVNGVENPDLLIPGTKLKVVRGPFRADVDLQANELTVFAGPLYAGRFPISVGNDPSPKPGEYRIVEKQPGRVYYAGDGRTIPAEDATNPYGRVWLGLGSELSIHSSPAGGEAKGMGCISLSPLDATDVYSILSQGSSVVIRR